MSTTELKDRLIEKIRKTENNELLQEAYRLLELDTENIEIYRLSATQSKDIDEARQQIQNRQFITDEQSNNEIDEWLSK